MLRWFLEAVFMASSSHSMSEIGGRLMLWSNTLNSCTSVVSHRGSAFICNFFECKRRKLTLLTVSGWDKHSYGYHGDDGHSFCSSGTGQPYGPTFTTGDVIGCCVNLINNTCFYTKNGISLGRRNTWSPWTWIDYSCVTDTVALCLLQLHL